jgi:TRAP-type C4-dicarboxylate transport system permease small subunit
MTSKLDDVLDRIYRGLQFFTNSIVGNMAAFVMLCCVLLANLEIIRRYVFGVVFNWGQDAVTYFIISSIFIFFAVTQARRSHLSVTALLDILKRKGYIRVVHWLRLVNSTVALSFYSAFAYWGLPVVERMVVTGRMTETMVMVLWPFQAALLFGFALMALIAAFQLYQDVQAVRGIVVFPWAETEEGIVI